jgi:tRNA threonylcarbamoyladenosine biosynthesis protein TsaE
MQISYTLADIQAAVHQFWQYAHQYPVMAFHGGLGAGKTTFTRALCAYLGVQDTVSSPTFSLINEYSFIKDNGEETVIYHSDWYRLNDTEEAIQAGIEDMLNTRNAYCIIEWAERAPELLPEGTLHVHFELEGADKRIIRVTP